MLAEEFIKFLGVRLFAAIGREGKRFPAKWTFSKPWYSGRFAGDFWFDCVIRHKIF